jgi:hypothetical protein
MKNAAVFTLLFGLSCMAAMGESWPSLEQYARRCKLIVLCESEMVDGEPIFKVVETWKGTYSPNDFNRYLRARIPAEGYLPRGLHSGRASHNGQKVIFFFTLGIDPPQREYNGASTSFDVNGGKLIYAETGYFMATEYTVAEFKEAIQRALGYESRSTGEDGD